MKWCDIYIYGSTITFCCGSAQHVEPNSVYLHLKWSFIYIHYTTQNYSPCLGHT